MEPWQKNCVRSRPKIWSAMAAAVSRLAPVLIPVSGTRSNSACITDKKKSEIEKQDFRVTFTLVYSTAAIEL